MARKRICIDCRKLTLESETVRGRCPRCRRAQDRSSFYQSAEWKQLVALARRVLKPAKCTICGSTWRLTLHHKVPRTVGGPDTLENMCWLCGDCHSKYEGDKRAGRSSGLTEAIDALAHAPTRAPRFLVGRSFCIAPSHARQNPEFDRVFPTARHIRARARLAFLSAPFSYLWAPGRVPFRSLLSHAPC